MFGADIPPLTPSPDDGRDWLIGELSKPEYQAAQPTLFDRVSQAIFDWIGGLLQNGNGVAPGWVPVVLVLVLILAVIAVLLIWGRPRANRRLARERGGALFGENDTRSAQTLRRDAEAAAARGDYSLAVLERFRALSRDLDDRTLIVLDPGTTAQTAMAFAGRVFPDRAADLGRAATTFDAVRYDDATLDITDWTRVRDLDTAIAATTPLLAEAVAAR